MATNLKLKTGILFYLIMMKPHDLDISFDNYFLLRISELYINFSSVVEF